MRGTRYGQREANCQLFVNMKICGDSSTVELPLFQGEDGGSSPTSPLQLSFRQITGHTSNLVVVESHYAHRAVPVSWAFGAYFKNMLLGVISFGKPASQNVCIGVCGKNNSDRVYELNRLWMSDKCPKNSESRFIGWALRQLKKNNPPLILVSYADTERGHSGSVYRATNWFYTGLSDRRSCGDVSLPGLHSRHAKKFEGAIRIPRSRKHRFVYFCDPKDAKLLKWQVIPYPSK